MLCRSIGYLKKIKKFLDESNKSKKVMFYSVPFLKIRNRKKSHIDKSESTVNVELFYTSVRAILPS